MATLSPRFEWPPDVEAAIYDHIHPHVQCGLKRRTWHAVHAELTKTIPRQEGRFVGRDGSCFLIRSNDEPVGLPEHRFAVIHVADPPFSRVRGGIGCVGEALAAILGTRYLVSHPL